MVSDCFFCFFKGFLAVGGKQHRRSCGDILGTPKELYNFITQPTIKDIFLELMLPDINHHPHLSLLCLKYAIQTSHPIIYLFSLFSYFILAAEKTNPVFLDWNISCWLYTLGLLN